MGAGLSGYSAAARLLENEIDNIVVLEAENRIGGRVDSISFSNGTIDMGRYFQSLLMKAYRQFLYYRSAMAAWSRRKFNL